MKNKIVIAVIVLFVSISMYSQKKQASKTNTKTRNKTNTKVQVTAPEKTAYVDPVKTYERIGDKGYKLSPEQLKKVGNACYFNGELEKAAKFYSELYVLTHDLEPEFYYRYAQSLKSIKEYSKADEMMTLFNQKKT